MSKSLFAQPLLLTFVLLAGCNRMASTSTSAESPANHQPKVETSLAADVATEKTSRAKSDAAISEDREPVTGEKAKKETLNDVGTFRVMSWNLEWFFDNESGDNFSELGNEQTLDSREQWDWKRDAVAGAIDRARPSVIGLQEIENKRVLFYLRRSLARNHSVAYQELCVEGDDFFTEQDVGLMYRSDADTELAGSNLPIVDPLQVSTFGRTRAQRKDKTLTDVGKHLAVTFEVLQGDAMERVTIVNVHLRAKEEGKEIRTRQARLVHSWVAEQIKQGENLIVLGDLNTDESVFPSNPGSDMHAILGLETPDTADDLIDLNAQLPVNERQTHLLKNKMFDRILVSRSLMEDDPSRVDLMFAKMQRLQELSVQGDVDEPQQHWDHYWEIDNASRDISDHWPIMATFQWK